MLFLSVLLHRALPYRCLDTLDLKALESVMLYSHSRTLPRDDFHIHHQQKDNEVLCATGTTCSAGERNGSPLRNILL